MSKDFSPLKTVPQMGDSILYHNNKKNFISESIEWFENGRVSHVDIYVGGGDQGVIGATEGGITKRNLFSYIKPDYTVIVRRIKGITVDQAAKMKDAAYKDIRKRTAYDYLAYIGYIIGCILRKLGLDVLNNDNPFASKNKLVCSEAYDKWAKESGLDLFPTIGEAFVTPQNILESNELETLIEV